MNWDVISAVSSTISSLAVVGSLVYLSLQIRQSNTISQGQTRTEFRTMANQELFKAIDFPEISASMCKPTLTEAERIRLHLYLLGAMRTREYIWLQYRAGLMDKAAFDGYARSIPHILSSERTRNWWREFRHTGYHAEFAAFVDAHLERTPPYDLIARLACLD